MLNIHLDKKYKNSFKNTVTGGLATFLVLGLSGCDGSNDSLATKQQKCKLQEYRIQHQEECDNLNNHSSGSSWVPYWLLMNNNTNGNAHSGYTYGGSTNNSTSKSSSYFSTGGSHSSSSGGS